MINRWIVVENVGPRKGCVIGLPGRNNTADSMENLFDYMGLSQTLCVAIEPHDLEWYPAPNGVGDQKDAIAGLEISVQELHKRISKIQRTWHLKRNQIALVGYSAGAVMALQVVSRSRQPFAACVALAGAILEPDKLPQAEHQTPILLRHNEDDLCFGWDERYLPMKDALLKKDYNVYVSEGERGGHGISGPDVKMAGRFVSKFLGYKTYEEDEE